METAVAVIGQLARDVVLVVDRVPGAEESGRVLLRREMLGGKGANQAVALAQLGMRPALVAVAGDDGAGAWLLEQAARDGVDVSAVVRRAGVPTGAVVRADAREAGLLAGSEVTSMDEARRAAADILDQGPSLVALAVGDEGNYFCWRGGELMLSLSPTPVADTTGAGDAFTAALIAGLARGDSQERSAKLAVAAAGATVGHPGGRPG